MNVINSNKDYANIKEKIIQIIKTHNQQLDDYLSDDSLHNLATHLTITIIRLQSENYIPLSNSQITSIQNLQTLTHAKNICEQLGDTFDIVFPIGEIAIVSMYLAKMHLLDMEFHSGFDLIDQEIIYIIKDTMDTIYETLGYDFRMKEALYIAIGLHLTPALERLQNNQMLENQLTSHIKENHALEYQFATIMNTMIKDKYKISFTDDELAFIAIHFVSAIK